MKKIVYYGDDQNPLYASIVGSGQSIIVLHGGGPDRQSILPMARLLEDNYQVIFPDIRGYGQSTCYDHTKHNWKQYAKDILSLIDYLGLKQTIICGMGLGASISERVAFTYPSRIQGLILISPETLDNEGAGSSSKEIVMMTKCAEVAKKEGLEKAWLPFIKELSPAIIKAVKEAFPRTDPESFAAAMNIVHSKRLDNSRQLSGIIAPTLVIPGGDVRHSSGLGKIYQDLIPNCILGEAIDWNKIQTMETFAESIAPQIIYFVRNCVRT